VRFFGFLLIEPGSKRYIFLLSAKDMPALIGNFSLAWI